MNWQRLYVLLANLGMRGNNFLFAHALAARALEEIFFLGTGSDKESTEQLIKLQLVQFIREGSKLPVPLKYCRLSVEAVATMGLSILQSVKMTNEKGFSDLRAWLQAFSNLHVLIPSSVYSQQEQIKCFPDTIPWAPYNQVRCHAQLAQHRATTVPDLTLAQLFDSSAGLASFPREIAASLAPIAMDIYNQLPQFHPGTNSLIASSLQDLGKNYCFAAAEV